MNTCQHCHRRSQLYLCPHCRDRLTEHLTNLTWLIDQLDTTITRQDRLTTGAIGRAQSIPAPINFDAVSTADETRRTLITIIRKLPETYRPQCSVTHDFIGPLPPAWRRLPPNYRPTTLEFVDWLMRRIHLIAKHPDAGDIYADIHDLVGDTNHDGTITVAINRTDRTYYGPCTTIVGKTRDGDPRECGADLYGPRESPTVTCRSCGVTVNAKTQLTSTIKQRDLVTEPQLLEALDEIGEHVPRGKFYAWVKAKKLTPRGYVHNGRIVPHRIRRGDPAVYSISRARQLRWNDQKKVKAKAASSS